MARVQTFPLKVRHVLIGADQRCFRHEALLGTPFLLAIAPRQLATTCIHAASISYNYKFNFFQSNFALLYTCDRGEHVEERPGDNEIVVEHDDGADHDHTVAEAP